MTENAEAQPTNGSPDKRARDFRLPEPEVRHDHAEPGAPPLPAEPQAFEVRSRPRVDPPTVHVPEPSSIERARGTPRTDVRVPEAGPFSVAERPRQAPRMLDLGVQPPSHVDRPRGTPREAPLPETGPYDVARRPPRAPPNLHVAPPNQVQQARGTPRPEARVPQAGPFEVAPRVSTARPTPPLNVAAPTHVEKPRGTPRTDVGIPTPGTPQVAPRPVREPGPNPLAHAGPVEARVAQPPRKPPVPVRANGPVEVRKDQPVRTEAPPLPTDPGRVQIQTNAMRPHARVMTTGVFDLIHLGHLHMLEAAKRLGDELVVVIARDETVRRMKHEPINGEETRRQIVERLKPVDRAILGHAGDIYRVVSEVRPDVIALGYDQPFTEAEVEGRCREHGVDARVVRLPQFDHDLDATRKIIERIGERLEKKELYPQRER